MTNHRKVAIAILSAAFLVAGLVGPAGAHFKKANGKGVSKKHAQMHRAQAQATQPSSVDLAPSGTVATPGNLRFYTATIDGATLQELINEGYDVTPEEQTRQGIGVGLVLSAGERTALEAKGIALEFQSAGRERKAGRQAVTAADSIYGWDVFRSYDEPGGIEDQIRAIANRPQNRGFLRLYDIGDSIEGRDILAVRMTQGARGLPLGMRPAVLYQGTTHAREWISTEVPMRLLEWYVAERRAGNPEIVDLLETTELWFVPVVNPDGYEFTFTTERLWRKNTRDNNGDGVITNGDGVDLNRNYPEHWNYDEEGSSSQFSSETYRGTAPGSEPEAAANMDLIENMGDFRFAVSYHSFGNLLLYPQGWQTLTPSADDPIYVALSGIDTDPAVEGYNPGVGADLYTTNGEFTDWAHGEAGVLAWTPELESHGQGFEFPDDEALVQAEFERNLEFALNVGRSAGDPDDPASHMGDTAGLYVNIGEIDPWKTNWPTSDLRVQTSYAGGSSQPVEVLAKRAVGAVTLHYSVNGGPEQTGPTAESPNGEVYGGNNAYSTYYHYLRGEIPGLAVGDSVEYWFTGSGESTDPVSFDVVEDADADVLIVAAEDYTGVTNIPAYASSTSPNYLSYYEDAVTASGRTSDVYDVDANDRTSPDHLGVLGHYDTVVWYEGNDLVTRPPDRGPGNVSRLAIDNVLNMRQYLNGGGNLLYAGQWAGATVNGVAGNQFYDPVADEPCVVGGAPSPVFGRCLLWADKNDFLQYYLGGFAYNSDGGTDPATGNPFPLEATDTPYTGGGPWTFNGADSAQNHVHTASFLTTSSVLPKDEYPQFTSDGRASWDRGGTGGSPFEPFDGDWYVYSQQADVSYKRLMRSFTVPGGGGNMTFRFSYDTEPAWDFVFVEIHDVAADTWVTAPDLNGHTNSDTGESCPAGWFELHPWLEQYQGADCAGAGWNAHSGRSAGWEEWAINLTPYAGKDIEISISYASDWAVQGLGAFVDQVQMPGEAVESFETGLGAWSMPGSPAGSAPNPNDWVRTQSLGFEEGAIVSQTPTTADFTTLYFGFGLEGVDGAAARADLMGRSLDFLGA
ncbi:MAG: M14 family zinc carboxypeptidase [Actinomycetota bacterium]